MVGQHCLQPGERGGGRGDPRLPGGAPHRLPGLPRGPAHPPPQQQRRQAEAAADRLGLAGLATPHCQERLNLNGKKIRIVDVVHL